MTQITADGHRFVTGRARDRSARVTVEAVAPGSGDPARTHGQRKTMGTMYAGALRTCRAPGGLLPLGALDPAGYPGSSRRSNCTSRLRLHRRR